jgi:hypothetical protein
LIADAAKKGTARHGRIVGRKNGSTVEKIIDGIAERDVNNL